jgi:hypothetical protein
VDREAAERKFMSIAAAYEVLSDPKARTAYDQNEEGQSNMANHFHHPGRHHSGRHYVFHDSRGRAFIVTEEELFARNQGHGMKHSEPSSLADFCSSLFTHLVLFVLLWYFLKAAGSDTPPDSAKETAATSTTSASTPKRAQECPLAEANAPHVRPFESRYLRHRSWRTVVFLVRNNKDGVVDSRVEAWLAFEQIALNFIHDRLTFTWIDLSTSPEWASFTESEFPSTCPSVLIFGSSGAKVTSLSLPAQLDVSPKSSARDLISRFIESVLEGTAPLQSTSSDVPN